MCFWELYSQHTSVCRAAFAICRHFFPPAYQFAIFRFCYFIWPVFRMRYTCNGSCHTCVWSLVFRVLLRFCFICRLTPHFLCPEGLQKISVGYGLKEGGLGRNKRRNGRYHDAGFVGPVFSLLGILRQSKDASIPEKPGASD